MTVRPMLALAALALAAAPGCGGSALDGDTIVFVRGADSKKLDPADVTDGESVVVVNQLFENLVTHAPATPELVPGLATAWTVSEDGRTWTFTLRPGVKFHDGTDCDAAAVKFSLDRLVHKDNAYRFGGNFSYDENYQMIESVEAPDAGTVVLRLRAASAVLLPNLAMFPACIVSPTAMQAAGEGFARHPVGTGPYRFVRWVADEAIELTRFDGYWGPRAGVTRVIFVPVQEQRSRLERLRRGEANMMNTVDFAFVAEIEADPALRYDRVDGMNFSYLAMNNDRKPFDDPRVRRAVAHAIDKAALITLAYYGFGKPGVNPMPPTIPGYHDGIADYPHDPAKAKALLAEAGYPDGFDTDLWAMPNPRPYMPKPQECGQILKEQLKAVGIRATIKSPPWAEYLERTGSGEHSLCVLGWNTDNGDPDNFLNVLLGARNARPKGANNVSFYRDAPVQAWCDEAQGLVDPAARHALYRRVQEKIHADVPMVPLAYMPEGMALRREVQGYVVNPIGIVRLAPVRLVAE